MPATVPASARAPGRTRSPCRAAAGPATWAATSSTSPISCIVVGTSTSRTIVASSAIATASPMPISLTCGTPVPAKIANTATMISAALEIVFALAARPCDDRLLRVAGRLVALLDAREHEDLVVHAQAEDDREQQHRRDRLHVAERLEAEEAVEPAPLEDDHQHAVGRRDRQHVHQHRLDRQHDAAQHQQQHEEAQPDHEQRDLPQRRRRSPPCRPGSAPARRRRRSARRPARACRAAGRRARSSRRSPAPRSGVTTISALRPSRETTGGATALHVRRSRSTAPRSAATAAWSTGFDPKSASTWTGPSAPGPELARREVEADAGLEVLREHRDRRGVLLEHQRRARRSAASARSRRARTAAGGASASPSSAPRSPARASARAGAGTPARRSCPGSDDPPARAAPISAGSSVTAASTAIATTTIAPTAIERTTFASTRNSPASATITVTPENVTAMPDVRSATRARLVGRAAARASSSR